MTFVWVSDLKMRCESELFLLGLLSAGSGSTLKPFLSIIFSRKVDCDLS